MDRFTETAALMLSAWHNPAQLIGSLPLLPVSEAQAYEVQRRVSEGMGAIGG